MKDRNKKTIGISDTIWHCGGGKNTESWDKQMLLLKPIGFKRPNIIRILVNFTNVFKAKIFKQDVIT